MVTSHPSEGHPPTHGWPPTNPGMVTHQPKDGQPPEGSVLQTWNLALDLTHKTNLLIRLKEKLDFQMDILKPSIVLDCLV